MSTQTSDATALDVAPPAAAIATRARHLVIRASAGSGKTYQLALRYLRQLLDGVPADQILASTFTRKAAGEILARVLVRLAEATRDEAQRTELAAHLGANHLDWEQCLHLLKQLTQSLHRLRVSTLDGFFARLATSYTLELGLPPGWEIIDELADRAQRRQAINALLRAGQTTETVRLTNLLARGDAGRSVSGLIQETIGNFYGIYRQTDAAAWRRFPDVPLLTPQQLEAAVEELRIVDVPDAKTVQRTRDKDYQSAVSGDWESFTQSTLFQKVAAGEAKYCRKDIPEPVRRVYQQLGDHARALLTSILAEQTAATYDLLAQFDSLYQQLKQETRGFRFEDVTNRLADAFRQEDDLDEAIRKLAYRLDGDVTQLLLDEFQDTSLQQWEVIRPFAKQITDAPSGTSFFCVGDAKQAIYGWRGGVAEIFAAIDDELQGVQTATLAKSFRSSQVIIDVVNQLFSKMPQHPNLGDDHDTIADWCAAVESHTTAKNISGHMTLEAGPGNEEGGSGIPTDEIIEYAADRVQQIAERAPRATIGVLVRQNRHIARLVSELRHRGVEASEEAGNPLVDSAAVVVLLSLLRMADHPGDTIACFHVATSPLGESLGFTAHDNRRRAARLAVEVRRTLVDIGYGAAIDGWARRLIPHCSPRDIKRLGQLVDLAYRHGEQATLRPMDFVRFVELERVDDPSLAKVRVMNIHQAKGLQFDALVLPLIEGRLVAQTPAYVTGRSSPTTSPNLVSVYRGESIQCLLPTEFQSAFAETQAASVQEALCILYVAVTRAKHALHIIVPPSSPRERNMPRSPAGLVRAALTDGGPAEPRSVLFEHGTADWAAQSMSAKSPDPDRGSRIVTDSPPLSVTLAEMTDGRSRGLGRMAPSKQAEPEPIRLSQLMKSPKSDVLDRGTLIHAWFEQIEWLDAGYPDDDRLRPIAQRMGFEAAQTQQYLASFHDMLMRPAIRDLLSKQAYLSVVNPPDIGERLGSDCVAEVERERRVAASVNGELLIGSIDRLVLLRQGGKVFAADIIDFKTDAAGTAGPAHLNRTAHYFRQLKAYANAISLIYELPPEQISARLLFVESGELVNVP